MALGHRKKKQLQKRLKRGVFFFLHISEQLFVCFTSLGPNTYSLLYFNKMTFENTLDGFVMDRSGIWGI